MRSLQPIWRATRPRYSPVEFFDVEWTNFADEALLRRPKGMGVSIIDSRTIRSTSGVDYHTRQMLSEFIEPRERAEIAVAHRSARHDTTEQALTGVNARIAASGNDFHDRLLSLQMDQSSRTSWESSLVPHVEQIPFGMAGQGQQASIKVALAMHRSADDTAFVLAEEPENHLSHTGVTKLINRIEKLSGNRQVFITTHSSFVLNRLGLDCLRLIGQDSSTTIGDLPSDTVRYFKRLSGYDTLRLVLAESVVLVEAPLTR